jgi:hypothetical protein
MTFIIKWLGVSVQTLDRYKDMPKCPKPGIEKEKTNGKDSITANGGWILPTI